jgi:ubiquitin-protein ligase
MTEVLSIVVAVLAQPNLARVKSPTAFEIYQEDPQEYDETARNLTLHYATIEE